MRTLIILTLAACAFGQAPLTDAQKLAVVQADLAAAQATIAEQANQLKVAGAQLSAFYALLTKDTGEKSQQAKEAAAKVRADACKGTLSPDLVCAPAK